MGVGKGGGKHCPVGSHHGELRKAVAVVGHGPVDGELLAEIELRWAEGAGIRRPGLTQGP